MRGLSKLRTPGLTALASMEGLAILRATSVASQISAPAVPIYASMTSDSNGLVGEKRFDVDMVRFIYSVRGWYHTLKSVDKRERERKEREEKREEKRKREKEREEKGGCRHDVREILEKERERKRKEKRERKKRDERLKTSSFST